MLWPVCPLLQIKSNQPQLDEEQPDAKSPAVLEVGGSTNSVEGLL